MSDNGRLIINSRGETVQVLAIGGSQSRAFLLQTMVRTDRATVLDHGITSELEMTPREMIALAAKLADQAGYAAEFTNKKGESEYFARQPQRAQRYAPTKPASQDSATDILTSAGVPTGYPCQKCGSSKSSDECAYRQCPKLYIIP